MKLSRLAFLAVLMGIGSGAWADEEGGPKPVTVDAAAQARFGISVTTLKGVSAPTGVSTTARVLDPSPLLQLDSELAAASASLAASRAEAQRTQKLFAEDRTASARALDMAKAQEEADVQRVNAVQRRLALEWGPGIAELRGSLRAELLNGLARARAELVRVEVPGGLAVPEVGTSIAVRGSGYSVAAADCAAGSVLGLLPNADPRLQTRGVLVELRGEEARLPIGQMLSAEVPRDGPARVTGVVLPRSALLRKDGRVWVYVQTAPNTFVRREVRDYHPALAGWFVSRGFAAGERVVITGAQALLGVESPAPADTDTDSN
ncbi:MAG TPA: hypothetical protein VHB68_17900 [Steroidobacteraceae bacterium]|nr:hypothetical protein [Steroidobacteraceae bacterium]